jgi:hypothetical protein
MRVCKRGGVVGVCAFPGTCVCALVQSLAWSSACLLGLKDPHALHEHTHVLYNTKIKSKSEAKAEGPNCVHIDETTASRERPTRSRDGVAVSMLVDGCIQGCGWT